MKANLSKYILVAIALLFTTTVTGAMLPVKMTYVDFDNPDEIIGEVDTIKVGYNKSPTVGGTVGFGNTGWGTNYIGYLQVDATDVPGVITKATLKAKISGSTDSKRSTCWGVALTDNQWTDQLNYTTTSAWKVSALLNGGDLVYSTQKSATVFEEVSFDITDALQGANFTGYANIIVYETAAAGGSMTEAKVEVEFDPYEATTTKFDFEDGVNIFTDDSRITSAIENDATLNSKVVGWTCAANAQNGYSFSHYDFTSLVNQSALVKMEFDYYNTKGGRGILSIGDAQVRGATGGSSKVIYNPTGVVFCIGSDKNDAFINDITLSQDGESIEDPETGETTFIQALCNRWLHVSLMINSDSKTVSWVVTDQQGELIHSGSSAFYADDANVATQIDLFGYINNSHFAMLDNLEITNDKSNAVFADYTVKYVDANGNELKEARKGNGQVGKTVKLLDSDKEPIRTDNMKYIYLSDDSEAVTIVEEGTVITVKFREAEKYYAVLNCKAGSETLKQFRGDDLWFWEGDTYTIYPSRGYKASDGNYWFTPATNWNGASFTFPSDMAPVTNAGKTYYIGTLNYEKDETVAYFANFEDLALPTEDAGDGTGLGQLVGTVNNWWSFSNGYFDCFDGGRGIRLDNGSYVYTEPIAADGTYMVRIYGRNDRSANCENPYALGVRDANGNVTLFDVKVPDWGSATTGESVVGAAAAEATDETAAVEAAGVGIKAGESLVVINTGNGSMISLDDVILTKVADYAATATDIPIVSLPYFSREGNTLSIKCDTEGAKIYYTLDGTDPTTESSLYSAPITLTEDCTVKAIAVAEGYLNSEVAPYVFTLVMEFENTNAQVVWQMNSLDSYAIPAVEEPLGAFEECTVNVNGMTVTSIGSPSVGSNAGINMLQLMPTEDSDSHTIEFFVKPNDGITFKPYTVSGKIARFGTDTGQVDVVVRTTEGNEFTLATGLIPLRNNHSQEDGCTSEFSYTIPVEMSTERGFSLIVNVNNLYANKTVGIGDVHIEGVLDGVTSMTNVCATPIITMDDNVMTISTATDGASIYYTLDGKDPTAESTLYSAPITLTEDCTVKAIATKEGFKDSEVSTFEYKVNGGKVEEIDENGIITAPADGTVNVYTVSGSGYKYSDGQAILTTLSDTTQIVECEDGTVYFKDIVSTYPIGTWVKGIKSGNTITVAAKQPIYYSNQYETTLSVRWARVEDNNVVANDENGDFIFTVDDDAKTISLQGSSADTFMAVFWDDDNSWTGNGVYETVYTFDHEYVAPPIVTITAPEGLQTEEWYSQGHTYSNGSLNSFKGRVTIGFDGSDVYLQGVFSDFPEAWIKGTIDGTTVTFSGLQYLGVINGHDIFSVGTNDGKLCDFVMNYDAEAGVLASDASNALLANVAVDSIYFLTWIDDITITKNGPAPKPTFLLENNILTISSAIDGSVIYYTMDGSDPTKESARYEQPIELTHNCIVKAFATAEGYYDSDIESYPVDWFKVSDVAFSYANFILTLSTATTGAAIHYTLDGSTPTASSPTYSEPLHMTEDCVVKAIATKANWHDSEVTSYTFSLSQHTASAPSISRSENTVTIISAEGLDIYYTLDGSDPTTESTRYEQPITLTHNCTVKAIATAEGYYNSDIASMEVDWFQVAKVTFTKNGTALELSTVPADAAIYYTIDGSVPTSESTLYTTPFSLTSDVTVKAIGIKEGFKDSEVSSYVYKVDEVTAAKPTFSVENNVMTISSATTSAVIYYTIDGSDPTTESTQYEQPITLTHNCIVKAFAVAEGYYDSAIESYPVDWFKAEKPEMAFDYATGMLTISCSTLGCNIFYSIGGGEPSTLYESPIRLTDNRIVMAVATAEPYFNVSDTVTFTPAPGGEVAEDGETFRVSGVVTADELTFIKNTMGQDIDHLDMSDAQLEGDGFADEALAGMNIVTFRSPKNVGTVGARLLKDCRRLAAVVWNASVDLPADAFEGARNPNLLLYVNSDVLGRNTGVQNRIVNHIADAVVLSDATSAATDGNFYCPEPFSARNISYNHVYKQTSGIGGECRGWETITLPFDVQTVTHRIKGEVTPFGSTAVTPHFWLYSLGQYDFGPSTVIEANKAYIISMPKNEAYAAQFVLADDTITFSAAIATVPATELHTSKTTHKTFVPNFTAQPAQENIYTMNVGDPYDESHLEGSVFLPARRAVRPFESFTTTEEAGVRFITIFDDRPDAIKDAWMYLAPTDSGRYDLQGRRWNGGNWLIEDGKKSFRK